jgi:hypothetical protein
MYEIKQFFNRIYNLIRWAPIIWKDQDWDHSYIWEIWKTKLKYQSEYIYKHGHHLDHIRDAERISLCYKLMDDIQSEHYNREYQYYHKSESVFTDSKDYPGMYDWDIVEISENFDGYFKKYPLVYKRVIAMDKPLFKCDNKLGIALNIAHINHLRAKRILFKILENDIERWWD